MKVRWLALMLMLLAAAQFGCSGSSEETEDPGLKVAKGDCPDCDPAGPSAFEQANMGLRFYVPGDNWKVAYQFKVRSDMMHEGLKAQQLPEDPSELPMIQEERRVEVSQPYLFGYYVSKVDSRKFHVDGGNDVMRDVALVRVEQGVPTDANLYSMQRLDTHEFALEFELDDLLRPQSETYYNTEYPHGRSVEVDQESSLSGLDRGSSTFPHTVPRVLTTSVESAAPAMTPELEAIADATVPGWRGATYLKYEFANGDLVFWAKGQLWPFFVDSVQGYGLLVEHVLASR